MNQLEILRTKLDDIDLEIIKLYEERMEIVKKVINFKINNNLPILDSSRESKMLENNLKKINNQEFKKYYKDVLNGFLKASRDLQKDILNNK